MFDNIQKLITDFFSNLTVSYNNISISIEETNILVHIKTNESGLLIGPNGRNLESIQSVLRIMINNLSENKYKLQIDVNDYKNSKDDRLFQFIQAKISEVKTSGVECVLPYYSPYERKKIHSFVSNLGDESFSTKSIGEGTKRRIHITKKEKKLSIDIDGDDI